MLANHGTRVIGAAGLAVMACVGLAPTPHETSPEPNPPDASPVEARIVAKTIVTREACAGRLTALEAAAVFEWLNRQAPPLLGTADRKIALAVRVQGALDWMAAATGGEPPAHADQSARQYPAVIESECRELLRRAQAALTKRAGCAADRLTINDLDLVVSRRYYQTP
jgi:hypothetical protein